MNMFGDIARENVIEDLCYKLSAKIKKYPRAKRALCEIGLEMIDKMHYSTDWTEEYTETFKKGAEPCQRQKKNGNT